MGIFSPLMTFFRTVEIRMQPWFRDHCFADSPVLPAVESLLVLAGAARDVHPGLDVREMADARFTRFLEIPANEQHVEATVELQEQECGIIRASLYTKRRIGRFFRQVEHAVVCFGGRGRIACERSYKNEQPFAVSGKRIYKELIPFGPSYRNVVDTEIVPETACARLHTPELPLMKNVADLGSPFLLDSGFHVACVWGQRFAGFVPFPVGFKSRRIFSPSLPGREYRAVLDVVVGQGSELEFDMDFVDEAGGPVEQVRGVRMRDVSGGRMNVPDWVRKTHNYKEPINKP